MTATPKSSPFAVSGPPNPPSTVSSVPQLPAWFGARPTHRKAPESVPSQHQDQSTQSLITAAMPSIRPTPSPPNQGTSTPASDAAEDLNAPVDESSSTASRDSSGFKIRIPRDLPNLPAVFRKRGAIRSQPSTSPSSHYSPLSPMSACPSSAGDRPLHQTKLILAPRAGAETVKRTHSQMLTEDTQEQPGRLSYGSLAGAEKKVKAFKAVQPELPTRLPSQLAEVKNLAIRTTPPLQPLVSTPKSDASQDVTMESPIIPADTVMTPVLITSEAPGMTDPIAPSVHIRHEESRSMSNSPVLTPTRLLTPTSLGGAGGEPEDMPPRSANSWTAVATSSVPPSSDSNAPRPAQPPIAPLHSHGTRSAEMDSLQRDQSTQPFGKSTPPPGSASSTPSVSESPVSSLAPIDLVRVGMTILDRLLSNPVCKSFINKVPLSVTNYHVVIKKPMDLTTIEAKLWKSLEPNHPLLAQQPSTPALAVAAGQLTLSEGYANMQEFERDLRRIYQNATYFNSPNHIIHKQAQSYRVLYTGLLLAYRERRLVLTTPMPQESYTPTLFSLTEPGPLYLFRAHMIREMDRKMTDISVDLFSTLHQPLFETSYEIGKLSKENPRFVRMYINKNRSVLAKCRDEHNARVAILTDIHVSKPFPEGGHATPGVKPKAGVASMVRIKARVLIGKPIGERHDMITVGDLDCPNAWIAVACVKAMDLDVDVPSKFEKGTLSKMRHEVIPYGANSKISPEHQLLFTEALGVKLPSLVPQGPVKPPIGSVASSQSPNTVSKPAASLSSSELLPTIGAPASAIEATRPPLVAVESSLPAALAALPPPTAPVVDVAPIDVMANTGLGITTTTTTPTESPAASMALGRLQTNAPVEGNQMVDIHDSGEGGRYMVRMRVPSLKQAMVITPAENQSALTASAPPTASPTLEPISIPTPLDTVPVSAPASPPRPVEESPALPPVAIEPPVSLGDDIQIDSMPELVASAPGPLPEPSALSTDVLPETLDVPLPEETFEARATTPIAEASSFADVPMDVSNAQDSIMSMEIDSVEQSPLSRPLSTREQQMLLDLKLTAREKMVPYMSWSAIEPTLTVDTAHGLFKRIYHVQGNDHLVVQNFKEMDSESFEQRVREVACLLKLRDLGGVGQIQAVIDDERDHLVGLSMTKYAYTLKAYATNARKHPSPCQKLSLVKDMVAAICSIHGAGLAHRDLSEVNIMVDEDPVVKLEDNTAKPWVRVIDFGKSVFVEREEVQRWSMQDNVPEEELALLPLVILPPDHGYKLYRSILTLPRTKHDHVLLPPVDPRSEDVYSLGVLIWRTFSGKSPWNGAIEDDLKTIRYLVSSDAQIKFQLDREISGDFSRELLLKCLTAEPETRWTARQLKEWLDQPEISSQLLREFEALGGGRKKMRKILD